MFFGFEKEGNRWIEKTPAIFKSLPRSERRRLFLNQYNNCVDNDERILKADLNSSLFDIFKKQIQSSLTNHNENRLRPKNTTIDFDIFSAKILNLFMVKKYDEIVVEVNKRACLPRYKFARLIYRIFASGRCGVLFDAKALFSQYVLEKVSKTNKDKSVYMKDDLIFIHKEKEHLLTIKLCFKEIAKDKLYLVRKEINDAWRFMGDSKLDMIYLVFPKNSSFRKHIELTNPCCAHRKVKLVPYKI